MCALRGVRALGGIQGRLTSSSPFRDTWGDKPQPDVFLAGDVVSAEHFGPFFGPFRGRGRVVQAYESRGTDVMFPFSPPSRGLEGISV